MPTDVTGVSVFNQKSTEFEFRPGPIFAQLVLADEVNRATPRTQAALLEAMAERRVTVDGVSHELAPPFLVMATQNPIDHEGTFPLPEAQLDRFLIRLSLGYPSMDEELKMLEMLERGHPLDNLQAVVSTADLLAAQRAVRETYVDAKVRRYLMEIVHRTRENDDVALGGSPRASLALFRTSQALAAVNGRCFVRPDDVKNMAAAVLTHRLILRPESRLRKVTAAAVVAEVVAEVRRADVVERARPAMRWFLAVVALLTAAAGLPSWAPGLRHVRPAGSHAVEPMAEPDLGREPDGRARVQSGGGERRREGGGGDHLAQPRPAAGGLGPGRRPAAAGRDDLRSAFAGRAGEPAAIVLFQAPRPGNAASINCSAIAAAIIKSDR